MKAVFFTIFALLSVVTSYKDYARVKRVDLRNPDNLKRATREMKSLLAKVGNPEEDPKSVGWNYQLVEVVEVNDLIPEFQPHGATQHNATVLATAQEGPEKGQERLLSLDYSRIVYPGHPVHLNGWSFQNFKGNM